MHLGRIMPKGKAESESKDGQPKRAGIFARHEAIGWSMLLAMSIAWPVSFYPVLSQRGLSQAFDQPIEWFTGFVLAHATLALFLLLGKFTWLRSNFVQTHPAMALLGLFVGTALATAVFHGVLSTITESQQIGVELVLIRFILVVIIFALFAEIHTFRSKLHALASAETSLIELIDSSKMSQESEFSQAQRRLYGVVAELKKADSIPVKELIALLKYFSEQVVRPWSHEIASSKAGVSFTPSTRPHPKWQEVWGSIFAQSVLKPLQTALWFTFFALSYSIQVYGSESEELSQANSTGELQVTLDVASFTRFLAEISTIFVATYLAALLARSLSKLNLAAIRGWSQTSRELVAIALLTLLTVLLSISFFIVFGIQARAEISVLLIILLALPVLLVSFVVLVSRAVKSALVSILDQLAKTNEELRWELARANQSLWMSRARLANWLHGPIRSTILATGLKIQANPQLASVELNNLTQKLSKLHGNLEQPRDNTDPLSLIFESRELWQGICEIELLVEPQTLEEIRTDETASSMLGAIVSECATNAVVHGAASRLEVNLAIDHETIDLVIKNNGQFDQKKPNQVDNNQGLGLRMISEASLDFSLKPEGTETVLRATIPFRGRAAA